MIVNKICVDGKTVTAGDNVRARGIASDGYGNVDTSCCKAPRDGKAQTLIQHDGFNEVKVVFSNNEKDFVWVDVTQVEVLPPSPPRRKKYDVQTYQDAYPTGGMRLRVTGPVLSPEQIDAGLTFVDGKAGEFVTDEKTVCKVFEKIVAPCFSKMLGTGPIEVQFRKALMEASK